MAAAQTGEVGLRTSILLIHIATAVARPTTVSWINEQQQDACTLRLVGKEVSKLPKAAITVLAALPFPQPYPVSDSRQLFENQHGLRVFRMRNQLLAYRMVDPALKAGLFP